MAGDGSHCCNFSSGGLKTLCRDRSQGDKSHVTEEIVGLQCGTGVCARGGAGTEVHAAGQGHHITCLTLAVFRQTLKRTIRTFLKDKLLHLYIHLLASAALSPLTSHFQALLQGQDEHNLQLKLWK